MIMDAIKAKWSSVFGKFLTQDAWLAESMGLQAVGLMV